jgi:glutathione S-transferase
MILYGSQTSPFIRRLRLLLPEDQYRFEQVDIFSAAEREKLKKLSPLLKVPIMKIDEAIVWDSRVIFNELIRQGFHKPLTLAQENLLTAISDGSDSLIQVLLAQRSHVVFPVGSPLHVSHLERIANSLAFLDDQVLHELFRDWNFLSMSLYSMVDWIDFRNLAPIADYAALINFRDSNKQRPRVSETDPRKPL